MKHVHTNSDHGYDSGCVELAQAFLSDIDVDCRECTKALAIAIQETIEDHLADFEECK
jgi:hypothetical protein